MSSKPLRSIVVTESNLTHVAQAIRDGRMVYHASQIGAHAGCVVKHAIDGSSPAAVAESIADVFFDPCCELLALLVSDG